MPLHPPFFDEAARLLEPVMFDLPGKIVAIDGGDGTGKTTLGRYLAWYFNVTLIESDNFLVEGQGLVYENAPIEAVIRRRLSKPRPVVLEGIVALRILKDLGRVADFHIHLHNGKPSESALLRRELSKYEAEFSPSTAANATLLAEPE